MGGRINIAVRFKDGKTVCQERWTNNLPDWFKTPAFYSGEENHLRRYIGMVAGNDVESGQLGAVQPIEESEYGLVVVDLISRTVLSCNAYTNLNRFCISDVADAEDNTNFMDCAMAGLLRHSTVTFEEFEDRGWREIGRSSTDRISLSEVMDRVKADQEAQSGIAPWNKSKRRVQNEFLIDASGIRGGMTVVNHDWRHPHRSKEGGNIHPEMKAQLRELGIPLTFEEGLLRDASPCFPNFPLEYRFHLAMANFLRPIKPQSAIEHETWALDAREKAMAIGLADSIFLRED